MARNEGEGSAFILGLKTGDFPLCPLPTRKLKSMMESPDKRLSGRHKAGSFIEDLAKLESRSVYLGMERDEVLVYGHTHMRPACYDPKTKVVNTGSWGKSPCNYYSFVEIDDGNVNIKEFKDGKILDKTD